MNDGKNTWMTFAAVALCAAAAYLIYKIYSIMRNNQKAVNPVTGRISSHYGQREAPTDGASTNHGATDIAVPVGTPVKAPWDGTVTKYWFDSAYGGGQSMLVKHANGYTTGYCHLSGKPDKVAVGGTVAQGEVIAYSGATGNVTGPHLHFTLRNAAGVKIDPETIFDFKA